MTTPATPSSPKPAGDDRNLVAVDENYVAPSFEDKLHTFWAKNSTAVLVLCVAVLLGIVAKYGWDEVQKNRDNEIRADFAAASTSEKLKAFALNHPGHPLAGVAQLQLADEAYTAGKSADAVLGYQTAVPLLKGTPFAGRAQLGLAMAQIQAGKNAEGEAALKALGSDEGQLKGVRAEAIYQLTSIAVTAARADDVKKFSDQLMALDPASPWTQRALAMRATVPVTPPAPATTTEPGLQIKLPGK
jgi:hypothetical protein